ncbi:site-specific integrase [Clostridium sp. HBUAS56010]|uniref:tyrosine-type recombinase/integrase n=1 Tax=Clostridium sp. HBUAS56010 TaxID=2571127 RepID=UPI00163DE556|nr:site-specific integrase [Clostridium sp. HBUAS56010]
MKYALGNGMINLDEVSRQVNMKMIEKVREIHKYKITPPSENAKDPRWQTHVEDITKESGRRKIKGNTEDELMMKLAEHYGLTDDVNLTMNDMYKMWLPYKRSITNSENTIYRHTNHWKRYCIDSEICNKNMKTLTTIDLESWANSLIKDNNMTRKEWQNVKVIIGGIWDYTYRKNLIKTNPWAGVKISVKYRQISKKPPETQVFVGNEDEKLISVCWEMYNSNQNESYLAILFNLYCGLRVGELVALKWKNVNMIENYLSVEDEEVHIRERLSDGTINYKWEIVDHTKTYTSRYVPLIPKALDILEKIIDIRSKRNGNNEFIFQKEGKHLNTNNVGNALRWACKKAGISNKSTHKIRKTFASKLDANDVPIDEIRILLGHTDAQTTLGYIYNPLPKEETLAMIENAF